MNQEDLVDPNLHNVISKCHIRNNRSDTAEIIVTYSDGVRERIWTYSPNRYRFDYHDFIGMTKIEAVFYCDRKKPQLMGMF